MSLERAARYVNMIAERISNASAEVQNASWLDGNLQTVINHLFPIIGEKGSVQVDAVQGMDDISALEDIMFHVKRLGIDPSLLSFGDLLSDGLGDGGFFRGSIMASQKANLLRRAIKNGLDRLCEIHIAYSMARFLHLKKDRRILNLILFQALLSVKNKKRLKPNQIFAKV